MPLYAILSFQDGLGGFRLINNFGTNYDWIIWTLISLVISTWFIFIPGVFSKIGNIHNIVILSVKFIPLVVAAVIGFVVMSKTGKAENLDTIKIWRAHSAEVTFFKISPLIGLFGSLASIFFAFDGFYVTAGVQSEMKEPKKLPVALVIGLGIITLIYLVIAISMSIGTQGGKFFNFGDWLDSHGLSWLFGLVNICIAFGVLGIINGFSMWAPRFIEDLIKVGEFWVPKKYQSQLNDSKPIVGSFVVAFLSYGFIIILTIIGALTYIPGSEYQGFYEISSSTSMARLYFFADLMANWCAVIAFLFIATSIVGGLINRKTKRVTTIQNKYFVPSGIIAVVLVFSSMLLSMIQPFADLIIAITASNSFDSISAQKEAIIANAMLIVILISFVFIMILPSLFSKFSKKKKPLTYTLTH